MKEFVDMMIGEGELRKKLNFILSKSKKFQLFESVLYNDKSGWIWGWVQNKIFKLAEEIDDWIEETNIEVKEDWEYDDDCHLCQLLKKADEEGKNPTLKETTDAFLKANKINKKIWDMKKN